MLLLYPLYVLVSSLHRLVQRFGPTTRLLQWFRQRQNLRWGLLAAPLSLAYVLVTVLISAYADDSGYGWLYLPFLVVFWNALKLAAWAPISLLQLFIARLRERRGCRSSTRLPSPGDLSDAEVAR